MNYALGSTVVSLVDYVIHGDPDRAIIVLVASYALSGFAQAIGLAAWGSTEEEK